MPRPLKPPRGLFVPTEVIFDLQLSPPLRDTLIQLMSLAWGTRGYTTPLLSYEMLVALTGKSKRTLQGHIAALRNTHTALRLQIAGGGEFVIVFNERLWTSSRMRKKLHSHVKEYKESIPESINPIIPVPDQIVYLPSVEERRDAEICTAPAVQTHGLDDDLVDELITAGVYPGLLSEIGGSGYSQETLRALLEWSRADSPTQPGGIFMARLRAEAQPPERFTHPPCPRCGQVGGHAAGCYMRYASPTDLEWGVSPDDLQRDADLGEV